MNDLSIVVAMSENRVIGHENKLPWNLPSDLKRFKEITMGHPIIMGRKTFESIGRILPGRENIVLTKNPNFKSEGLTIIHDFDQALSYIQNKKAFIIGGGEIFKLALPLVNKIYLTTIHQNIVGDAFFPNFEKSAFQLVKETHFSAPIKHTFQDYVRA